MIVDTHIFKKFYNQFEKKNIYKIKILAWDFFKSLIHFWISYLGSFQIMYFGIWVKTNIEGSYIYYKSLVVWIKSCYSYKYFLSH